MENYTIEKLKSRQLTKNFTLYELTASYTARFHHLDNVPDEAGISKLSTLCEKILQPVRDYFKVPVIIRSGYRSAQVNTLLNEAPNSRHLVCEAVDFRVKGIKLADVCSYIADNLDFDLLQLEFPDNDNTKNGWVHIAYSFDDSNRRLNLQTYEARRKYKLSANFSLYELTHSATAESRRIFNLPDEAGIERLHQLCLNILQPVRDHYGKPVNVSSGYRSRKTNTAIGGARSSQHMKCEAADYEIMGISNLELANWVAQNLVYDQLILEYHNNPSDPNSGWVHTSFVLPEKRNRRQILTINHRGTHSGLS